MIVVWIDSTEIQVLVIESFHVKWCNVERVIPFQAKTTYVAFKLDYLKSDRKKGDTKTLTSILRCRSNKAVSAGPSKTQISVGGMTTGGVYTG